MRTISRRRLARAAAIACAMVLGATVACGGEDEPEPPKAGTKATPAAGAQPPAGSGSGKLSPMVKVETRVSCPLPQKGSRKCDPNAAKAVVIGKAADQKDEPGLACEDGEYCLQTSDEGYLCGKCPERDQIRHVFKDRDFAVEQNRDPFQSFFVKMVGAGSGSDGGLQKDPTSRCPRADQLVATNYGYQDLKLVGIVAQGTQRKVLMMDPTFGHIIKRGDCVGKEKAWVKDIGENFICFEVAPDASTGRPVEAHCFELHSKTVATTLPSDAGSQPPSRSTSITPVVPPPATLPPPASTPVQTPAPAPAQPPTTIKP